MRKNQELAVVENNYFSARPAHVTPSSEIYWDILRKEPVLGWAIPEMLEIIAGLISVNSGIPYILVPIDDHALFRDLQILGCTWIGYGSTSESKGAEFQLWDTKKALYVLSVSEVNSLLSRAGEKIERLVFKVGDQLSHDPRWGVKAYLEFVRSRERYFAGLSETDYLKTSAFWEPKAKTTSDRQPAEKGRDGIKRPIANLKDALKKRASAQGFVKTKTLTMEEWDSILEDSYYLRPDGHYPVAIAGGLGDYRIHIVSSEMEGASSGHYVIDSCSREWSHQGLHPSVEDLILATFSQDVFRECGSWLILEADLEPLAKKYGNRAYRFAVMGAGALLQTLHLSCTSHGIRFRAAGGFDDGLMEKFLKITPDGYHRVLALAGLGK